MLAIAVVTPAIHGQHFDDHAFVDADLLGQHWPTTTTTVGVMVDSGVYGRYILICIYPHILHFWRSGMAHPKKGFHNS